MQPLNEKVYIHMDRSNYFFGDTIWYKAYTLIGQDHQLSALSGVLYVELISPKDSLIIRQKLHLVSGLAWCSMPLDRSLTQGIYHLRAYTNWMRNFGPEYFYDQKIRLGGAVSSFSKKAELKNPDVQFFPEGGQLVNGIRSRVAVKSVDSNGLGENIKGTIEDNEGNIVADLNTQHLGMGIFAFVPQRGKSYKARINIPGENIFTVDLPKAQDAGYTLALNNTQKDSIYIKIAVNENTFNEKRDSVFYIIAQCNGKVYFSSQDRLEALVYSARVEKKRFPTGIVQFTLFSQSGEPIAERIAFIQSADILNLKLTSSATNYTLRQGVKLALDTRGYGDKTVAGSFSVAVTNESRTVGDESDESTILNNVLLTSDLKGNIEQPNYYFTNVNDQKRSDLDILMLTQGYRRFGWSKVFYDVKPNFAYLPEKSLEVTGTLKTSGGKSVSNGKVILIAAKEKIIKDTITNWTGNFKFNDLVFTDTATLVLRARKENKGSNVKIRLIQPDYPSIVKFIRNNQESNKDLTILQQTYEVYQKQQQNENLKNGIRLEEVKIKSHKRKSIPDLLNSSNLNRGGADQVIMGENLGGCVNLSDCLIGKLVKGQAFGKDVNSMVIIVDGLVLGKGHVDDVNPNDIYSIEVLASAHSRAVYGSLSEGQGILVITLKRGGESTSNLTNLPPAGIITFPFIGYTKTRTFYSPKYNRETKSQQQDERNTIYWNPNVITGKDGKASFEYFNNDTKGTYRVVVEGIDDDGNLGRAIFKYEVK